MKAHELRRGFELRDNDGSVIYRIVQVGRVGGGKVVVLYSHRDGGDGRSEFEPDVEVPHVRPTPRERVERYVAARKALPGSGPVDQIHELHGGDRLVGGVSLYLGDLETLLAYLVELDAARASDSV